MTLLTREDLCLLTIIRISFIILMISVTLVKTFVYACVHLLIMITKNKIKNHFYRNY